MGTCSIPGINLLLIHRVTEGISYIGYEVSMKGWHVTRKRHASESDSEAPCTLFSDVNLTLNNLASSNLSICSDYAAHQHHSSTEEVVSSLVHAISVLKSL